MINQQITLHSTVWREASRSSNYVDEHYTKVFNRRFKCKRRLTTSLSSYEAAEVFACLQSLWSSENTVRICRCLDLHVDESFRNMSVPHALDLKASLMGFIGDTRKCHKYQVTCFKAYRLLYLKGLTSRSAEVSHYSKQLKLALLSNRLNVTHD